MKLLFVFNHFPYWFGPGLSGRIGRPARAGCARVGCRIASSRLTTAVGDARWHDRTPEKKKQRGDAAYQIVSFRSGSPLPSAAFLRACSVCLSRPPLALRRLVGRCRRRRLNPGVEAFVGLLAVDEHPPGTLAPSLPFMLCEAEHRNPNLKGIHVHTHTFAGSAPVHGDHC
jgi:hypothetical protein